MNLRNGQTLNIPIEKTKWYSNAWVGRLRNLVLFDKMEDEIMWVGGKDIMPKYLDYDMVLSPSLFSIFFLSPFVSLFHSISIHVKLFLPNASNYPTGNLLN